MLVIFICFVVNLASEVEAESCDLDNLTIITNNKVLVYSIEISDTASERKNGLMHRKYMPYNSGMLFIFKKSKYIKVWMKNTYIVLDLIFIDANGIVNEIIRKAKPLSRQILSSIKPAKFLLEVPSAGQGGNFIEIGDVVIHCLIDK